MSIEKLTEWTRANVREGANLAEFEELASGLKLPDTPEGAWDFIQKNKPFKSYFDSALSKKNAEYDKRFQEEKLPDIEKQLTERLRAELNPKETPEQKTIRELKERLDAKERNEKIGTIREALRKKASEKGFDPDLAAELAVFGDDAEARLEAFAEKWSAGLNAKIEEIAKQKFGAVPQPKGGGNVKALSQEQIDAMLPKERAAFFASGGVPL
jgi:hypothetical protein